MARVSRDGLRYLANAVVSRPGNAMLRAVRSERMIYRAPGSALIPGGKWPRQRSVAGDGEVSHTLRIEKCFSACF